MDEGGCRAAALEEDLGLDWEEHGRCEGARVAACFPNVLDDGLDSWRVFGVFVVLVGCGGLGVCFELDVLEAQTEGRGRDELELQRGRDGPVVCVYIRSDSKSGCGLDNDDNAGGMLLGRVGSGGRADGAGV